MKPVQNFRELCLIPVFAGIRILGARALACHSIQDSSSSSWLDFFLIFLDNSAGYCLNIGVQELLELEELILLVPMNTFVDYGVVY